LLARLLPYVFFSKLILNFLGGPFSDSQMEEGWYHNLLRRWEHCFVALACCCRW